MSKVKECCNCGRLMEFRPGKDLWPCPGCGTLNKAPQVQGLVLDNFRRAIQLKTAEAFCEAEESYSLVLNSHPDDPEALWSRLLCHYGAAFVDDKGQRRYTIHFPQPKPMRSQTDYVHACELAEPELRAQYEQDAAYIDQANQRILELARTKPAYDVYLCHKTTRLDGPGYTEDYNRAYRLYNLLTKKGYRVFFAPVEMQGVAAGENYEAAIYHALETAKVMLVVCSDIAHLNATWVKSEWKRYLARMDRNEDKTLVPLLYGGMQAYCLPQEFHHYNLQAINMELDGEKTVLKTIRRHAKPRGGLGIVIGAAMVLVLVFMLYTTLGGQKMSCDHSNSSWKRVDVSYTRRDNVYHTITEENALICNECGMVLDRSSVPSIEMHIYVGDACEKCGSGVTPSPSPTACPHPIGYTYVDWDDWIYTKSDNTYHNMVRYGDEYCALCGAWLRKPSEASNGNHSYAGGKCTLCGTTATPKPVTPTPRQVTPTPKISRTNAVWEISWDGVGLTSHTVKTSDVGGVNEGVYPDNWEYGRSRFPSGRVICIRGILNGNGSQSSVSLRWRVIRVNEGRANDTAAASQFESRSTMDSSFIVWFKSLTKGNYYLEIYYFKDGATEVIGRYDFELY